MSGATVTDFTTEYLYQKRKIEFTDLHPVGTSDLMIGSLLIDGKNMFRRNRFTGPILFHNEHMFLPMARSSEQGFQLSVCAMNLKNGKLLVNQNKFDFIQLKGIKKNWLVYSSNPVFSKTEYMDLMWVF